MSVPNRLEWWPVERLAPQEHPGARGRAHASATAPAAYGSTRVAGNITFYDLKPSSEERLHVHPNTGHHATFRHWVRTCLALRCSYVLWLGLGPSSANELTCLIFVFSFSAMTCDFWFHEMRLLPACIYWNFRERCMKCVLYYKCKVLFAFL